MLKKCKNLLLDIFFPKTCIFCEKEGAYLCADCFGLLDILSLHSPFRTKYLDDLYFPLFYQNLILKKLIQEFKYPPFIKELSNPLSYIIIAHFKLIEKPLNFFKDFLMLPIPQSKKRLKWRGFNQAEELAKELALFFKTEILNDVIEKIKETESQVNLTEKERKENLKGAFFLKKPELIKNRKIILVDDVYTTGATMEEVAKILKENGAKEVIGIVIAKANPGEDKILSGGGGI
jgi:competence protein ComFC